jgi:hypothetical protein
MKLGATHKAGDVSNSYVCRLLSQVCTVRSCWSAILCDVRRVAWTGLSGSWSRRNLLYKPLTERDRLRDVSVDGRIILKCVSNKYNIRFWSGFRWL